MSDESEGGKTLIPLFDRLAAGDTSAADEIIKHSYGATGGSTVRTAEDLVTFIQGIRAAPLQPKAIGMAVSQGFGDGIEAKQILTRTCQPGYRTGVRASRKPWE